MGARVMLGEIGRPHGVRGLVRVRSFTAVPEDLGNYGPLTDEAGARKFRLTMLAPDLARIEGVADREAAAKLTGTKLYVAREALPPPEDEEEFYLADLVGLRAELADGTVFGTVTSVEDHGAGAFLAVMLPGGRERFIPFTRACVPVVAVAEGRLVVDPPAEVEGEERAA
jgi:16S rRNA processing protein RimM